MKLIETIRATYTDPNSPIYGSDVVSEILDLCNIVDRSGFDLLCCGVYGEAMLGVPEGLAYCGDCAKTLDDTLEGK